MPREWPTWWSWDLDLSPHLLKRMVDRRFTEVDLRKMLHLARDYRPDMVEYRWVVEARYEGGEWEIIVEPDTERSVLVVVTAFRVD